MSKKVVVPVTGHLSERPYSAGIVDGDVVYISGHTGSDPMTRHFKPDIEAQTHQALSNIRAVMEAAGGTLEDISKVNIYMTDMTLDFAPMNTVFRQFFPKDPPARCTVGVSHLARPGLRIEVEAVGRLPAAAR